MATPPKTTAVAKSLGASLAINSVSDLRDLANLLYTGGASQIPGLGRPEAVAHVILAGAEVGFTPTQALSCIMLLDGKTTIYGDGALALVRASGLLDGEIVETVEGEGDARTATCTLARKGESRKTFTFSMAEARRAGLIDRAKGKGPWVTYPDRMLKMRARGFALRDLFSDVLRGLAIYEEAKDSDRDVVNTEVKVTHMTAESAAPPATGSPAVDSPKQLAAPSVPAAYIHPSAPAPAAAAADGPVTTAQLDELVKLRNLFIASKGIAGDSLKIKAEWEQVLAPYNTTSARSLTANQAADLIAKLGQAHDPFCHPNTNGSQT